mgnify:CR=1 FL=1
MKSRNACFASEEFPALLKGLWAASGSGSASRPANFAQNLVTRKNDWFGISGGKSIDIVWVYLNPAKDWYSRLSSSVQFVVDSIDSFPNYSTFTTNLKSAQVNLISSLTAWGVADDSNSTPFKRLFQST